MDCGSEDTLCQAAAWLSENEFVASFLAERIATLGASTTHSLNSIFLFIKEYSQSIIGAFGVTFGAWRWWTYRERILHERLTAYINESDRRLTDAERDLVSAMRRPGPSYPVSLPVFASNELRCVLRERNWDKTPYALTVSASADGQLRQAISKLERQILTARQAIASLHQQSATAYLIRGAIAASKTESGRRANIPDVDALDLFRSALQLDDRNVLARELEGLHLKKLGHYNQAMASFDALEQLAGQISDKRQRIVTIARAKRYRGEISQYINSTVDASGLRTFQGSMAANGFLSETVADSALSMRLEIEPFQGWDLLEHGDTYYVAAFVSHNLNFSVMRNTHLAGAHNAYTRLSDEPFFKSLKRGRRFLRLRRLALEGKERVERAQQQIAFDYDWLGK